MRSQLQVIQIKSQERFILEVFDKLTQRLYRIIDILLVDLKQIFEVKLRMGMITRVRGRLHSITKIDPQVKEEKIAETGKLILLPILPLEKLIIN